MSDIAIRDENQLDVFDEGEFGSGFVIAKSDFDIDPEWLVGVPHVITSVSFRPSELNQTGFVSCEATVGPLQYMQRAIKRNKVRVIDPEDGLAMVKPGEKIGYNDGSTGIRRQIVKLLEDNGMLKIKSKAPANGPSGESRYDTNFSVWEWAKDQSAKQGELTIPCFTKLPNGAPFSITTLGGLIDSRGGDNRPAGGKPTYYLA